MSWLWAWTLTGWKREHFGYINNLQACQDWVNIICKWNISLTEGQVYTNQLYSQPRATCLSVFYPSQKIRNLRVMLCSLLHRPEHLCLPQWACWNQAPCLRSLFTPILALNQAHCHTALGPWPTITLLFSFSHLSLGLMPFVSAKPSTVSPPGQILAFLQGRRLSGSTSSKNTPPVFLHLQSGMRKSQSLYFISSLISIFIYFLMPNYHPKDDNSYSNNGCTGHCSTAFQGIKFSLIL